MPRERGRIGNHAVGQRRCGGQVKNMCTGNWLRSAWGTGNSHHQEGHGQCFLRGVAAGKPVCGEQTTEEDAVKISIRDVGNAKVVKVEGDVDLGTSPLFRRTLFETLPRASRLALDLEAIRYIDSSGIATLIEVLKDSQRLKKEFVLFGLSPAVQEVFRLTHVIRIFQVFQTEQEALGTA